jgi:ABC-type transporter Mla MlaB component
LCGFIEKERIKLEQSQNENRMVVSCGELLEISKAQELYNILKQSLESALPIDIDASAVERVDAAVLQLLCAYMRDASACGKDVRWRKPAEAFIASARLLRLDDLLALIPASR